jgi:hypothetical protein
LTGPQPLPVTYPEPTNGDVHCLCRLCSASCFSCPASCRALSQLPLLTTPLSQLGPLTAPLSQLSPLLLATQPSSPTTTTTQPQPPPASTHYDGHWLCWLCCCLLQLAASGPTIGTSAAANSNLTSSSRPRSPPPCTATGYHLTTCPHAHQMTQLGRFLPPSYVDTQFELSEPLQAVIGWAASAMPAVHSSWVVSFPPALVS